LVDTQTEKQIDLAVRYSKIDWRVILVCF